MSRRPYSTRGEEKDGLAVLLSLSREVTSAPRVTLIQRVARLCCHKDCLLFVRQRYPIPRFLGAVFAPSRTPRGLGLFT